MIPHDRLRAASLAAAFVFLCCASPVRRSAAQVHLHIQDETAPLAIPAGFISPARGNGGVYLEFSSQTGAERSIHWFSKDGNEQHLYSFDSIRNEKSDSGFTAETSDYQPTPTGLAALMVWHNQEGALGGYTIEEWFQSGIYRNSIPIPPKFSPRHLASFGNGNFLVLGGSSSETGLKSEEALILDFQGRIETRHRFRELKDPDNPPVPDSAAPAKALSNSHIAESGKSPAEEPAPETAAWQLSEHVGTTQAAQGGDGYVFLAEQEATGKIYRISRFGVVEELHLLLPPELKGQHTTVSEIAYKDRTFSRLLMVLDAPIEINHAIKPKATYLVTNNTDSGDIMRFYQVPNERVSAFPVSLDENDLRFLSFTRDPATKVVPKTIVTLAP